MSKSSASPGGQTAYQRWELSSLGDVSRPRQGPEGSAAGLEALRRKARDEGYAEGMALAKAEAEQKEAERAQQMQQWELRLSMVLESCVVGMDRLRERLSQDLSMLAIDWAEAIAMAEVTNNRELLLRLIGETIEHYPGLHGPRTLTLHPQVLHALSPQTRSTLTGQGWRLASDAALSEFACHLSTGDLLATGGISERAALLRDRILAAHAGN